MLRRFIREGLELEIWEVLERVTDPELDEPVTEMGFVERVAVADACRVEVDFRLPTYWCSPNFAFLMSIGIRREIMALPWVRAARVTLLDHCLGEKVNEAVNGGRDFAEVFAAHCDGADLSDVAGTFLAKAFDRRQEAVILGLRAAGRDDAAIAAMTLGDLDRAGLSGAEAARQRPRYRALLLERGLARAPDDPAFPRWDGGAIGAAELPAHLARLRATRINMEFNGALCRGLAAARYKEVEIGPEGPTLVDFIVGRVPPREAAEGRS
ncbi:iron-sulfur cluster assembly protein [Poseidonocella sp. HB161398]|uniref:iron-sulfur cluster assembly protein n=1 Tax=Poseidonocella sp. HB161398 TaxID=2320855 RepID=UPI001107EACC|nr:iron-sulfur cluster assembly protein [Poseidonocella sp. HB161398]